MSRERKRFLWIALKYGLFTFILAGMCGAFWALFWPQISGITKAQIDGLHGFEAAIKIPLGAAAILVWGVLEVILGILSIYTFCMVWKWLLYFLINPTSFNVHEHNEIYGYTSL